MELLILALASFRLTRLLVFDKITEFLRRPFFEELEEKNEAGEIDIYITPKKGGIRGFLGQLLSCYWCTGVWTSIVVCVLYIYFLEIAVPILIILAVAGLAAIFETIVQKWLND
ncbi:DUF1360 domain-containing protein [Bacillus sp. DTU_2020_1000418_1_SI_GHA_SEK_038]|uniref:DUF1360 domain-containing protein n=1 Tax=Bacillus sp. DTU_2020_1000418_1_SI_GHA_SEK_038 TaxID=3077585 RepID=UPI0028E5B36E|nr:DUF1360 domain-containing protein [Bacillus sp. DTU_2020_1000418_1_SI_GHA_SEK_038]WNS76891.1 DUF1360 domain-containing protein [Bacillus sp. DTU_2020_1000418_1_SI_GHA_SEK_038]